MKYWPHKVLSYSPWQVQEYCVQDDDWQKVRLSMKGKSTEEKLRILDNYRDEMSVLFSHGQDLDLRHRIQIDNYVNALKRGGQLNMQLEVVK